MTDRPATFSIYDHHTFYNTTDQNGVQRGTINDPDTRGDLWAKYRASCKASEEHLAQYPGGLTVRREREEILIMIEQQHI